MSEIQLEQKVETVRFDKFCLIKGPSRTKGCVALVGDAGHCASPASGSGASLAMAGAALVVLSAYFVLQTAEAIHARNTQRIPF